MTTVAKKAKHIGLVFSVVQMATIIEPDRCRDIPGMEMNDYVFTDGYDLISPHLAHEVTREVGGRVQGRPVYAFHAPDPIPRV
jgi:hypothetical protein